MKYNCKVDTGNIYPLLVESGAKYSRFSFDDIFNVFLT